MSSKQQPSVLQIVVKTGRRGSKEVRVLIDGADSLSGAWADEGYSPQDVLGGRALEPTDPPRRVAFYGCTCGEPTCANITAVIKKVGDFIIWTDFASVTGNFDHPLSSAPFDGFDEDDEDDPPRQLKIAQIKFDAAQYTAELERAGSEHT